MDGDTTARVIYLGILVAAVGSYLLVEFRGRMGQMVRGLVSWGLIIVGLMAGYGLWNDMSVKIMPQQSVADGGEIVLPRAPDGHYYVTLQVDGQPIEFMVDTGASGMVLAREDAVRLGIDPASLAYLGSAQTANGTVRTSRITLETVELGAYRDAKLRAFVTEGEMGGSLLGMDYLGRFKIEIAGGEMIWRR